MSELVPNNLIETLNYPAECPPRTELVRPNKPYEEYDVNGNVIGYSWYQGDTVELAFHIDGKICVEANAIIYTSYGDGPTIDTEGQIGQKAYNVVELKSWTCVSISATEYSWQLDAVFTNPPETSRAYYVSAKSYLEGKILKFRILNFRKQAIFETQQPATTDVYFTLSRENSLNIAKGTYTVELISTNLDNTEVVSILSGTDCQLFVR